MEVFRVGQNELSLQESYHCTRYPGVHHDNSQSSASTRIPPTPRRTIKIKRTEYRLLVLRCGRENTPFFLHYGMCLKIDVFLLFAPNITRRSLQQPGPQLTHFPQTKQYPNASINLRTISARAISFDKEIGVGWIVRDKSVLATLWYVKLAFALIAEVVPALHD